MAKFIYRMQSILDIKEKLEEQAKMEFAQANGNLAAEEEKLLQLQKRKALYEQQGRELQKDSLKIQEILENREAISRINEFIVLQQLEVQRAKEAVEKARLKLTQAMQESKTQNKLKEKAFETFIKEENAKEAKEVDELTSYTYGQKR